MLRQRQLPATWKTFFMLRSCNEVVALGVRVSHHVPSFYVDADVDDDDDDDDVLGWRPTPTSDNFCLLFVCGLSFAACLLFVSCFLLVC